MLNCPIKKDLEEATELGGEFSKQMEKVRKEIEACEGCEVRKTCKVRIDFNQMVDKIVAELNEEWGM
jgi:hypothetical protein